MVDAEIADYYARGLERDRLTVGRARIGFIRPANDREVELDRALP